ncbi:MAG: hypothetical protein M0R33_13765 [Methylomonas sp.]|jgi:hypothetical protein|uniref:hypothetical protein n=1 Tax=Methylomonas sp. TaxID=418 RepID=UPI0025F8CD9C|nr:hypothetical protein [Methylomonas sp.]MCK9607502.1 hypothetical protein [Methylomonas sp.]
MSHDSKNRMARISGLFFCFAANIYILTSFVAAIMWAIIIAIIIVLILIVGGKRFFSGSSGGAAQEKLSAVNDDGTLINVQQIRPLSQDGNVIPTATERQRMRREHPEYYMVTDNIEHFESSAEVQSASDTCANTAIPSAMEFYGAQDTDYQDWLKLQNVDSSTIQSHAEFVADRLQRNDTWVGHNLMPDKNDEYDYIPWVGLQRPRLVAVGNPDQVTDINPNTFSSGEGLRWT